MKIKSLEIKNFKSFRERTVEFGDATTISGQNTSGKTTVFDAFTWLLFGKDSLGNTQFEVRPLDKDGNKIHNLEISVTGTIEHDGKEHTLCRTQVENWVKKRGTTESTLQGNVNKYEIDGYPRNEAEYKQFIDSICAEKVFRLLTSPMAFTSLPWKEQRAILMEFAVEASDAELARGFGGYEEILDELEKAPDTDLILKKYAQDLKMLKQRQAELPVRIDEAAKMVVEVDVEKLNIQKAGIEASIADTEEKMTAYAGREKERTELVKERGRIEMELARRSHAIESDLYAQKRAIDKAKDSLVLRIDLAKKRLADAEREYSVSDASLDGLGKVLDSLNAQIGKPGKCSHCGQPLSDEAIKRRDESVKDTIADTEKQIADTKKRMAGAIKDIKTAEEEISTCEKGLREQDALSEKIPTVEQAAKADAQHMMLVGQMGDVTGRLMALNRSDDGQYEALKTLLDGLRAELSEVNAELVRAKQNDEIADRIEDLRQEQMDVGDKVIAREHKRDLVEAFIKQKMDAISGAINGQFDGVNFKLFDVQLNGGIAPTCECTVDGVPFGSLNNGGRIVSGLKIIRTLQKHYGVSLPVFVDNAEAVSDGFMPEMDGQMILLKVTNDKELTIR